MPLVVTVATSGAVIQSKRRLNHALKWLAWPPPPPITSKGLPYSRLVPGPMIVRPARVPIVRVVDPVVVAELVRGDAQAEVAVEPGALAAHVPAARPARVGAREGHHVEVVRGGVEAGVARGPQRVGAQQQVLIVGAVVDLGARQAQRGRHRRAQRGLSVRVRLVELVGVGVDRRSARWSAHRVARAIREVDAHVEHRLGALGPRARRRQPLVGGGLVLTQRQGAVVLLGVERHAEPVERVAAVKHQLGLDALCGTRDRRAATPPGGRSAPRRGTTGAAGDR